MIFKSFGALCAVGLGLMVVTANSKAAEIGYGLPEKTQGSNAPESAGKLGPIVKIADHNNRAFCYDSQNKSSSDACLMKQSDAFDYCNSMNKDFNTQVQVAKALGYKWEQVANGTGMSTYTGEVSAQIPAGAYHLPTIGELRSEFKETGQFGPREYWFWSSSGHPKNSDEAYAINGYFGSFDNVRNSFSRSDDFFVVRCARQ